jgi:hypothetical protein
MRSIISLIASLLVSLWLGALHADPTCMASDNQALGVNNEQVVQWKRSSPNEYHSRGHITGKVTAIFDNATGHNHFEVTIDGQSADTIEMVFSGSFGRLPQIHQGDQVEACGDYITANANYQGYSASPDGAIIHWLHRSDTAKHPDGYLIVNGQVYGLD